MVPSQTIDQQWQANTVPLEDVRAIRWQQIGCTDRRALAIAQAGTFDANNAAWHRIGDELITARGTGFLAALVGRFGAGKTVMALHVARQFVMSDLRVRYVTAPQFFRAWSDARGCRASEEDVLERFSSPDLLVIDEAHERSHSDAEDRRLTECICSRFGRLKDTLLVSNTLAEEFAASIGGSVCDRMQQSIGIVACNWPSYRARVHSPAKGIA